MTITEDIKTLTKKERLLNVIQRQPVDRPPVWLMRQAGRYLPSYQEVRKQYTFHEMCAKADVAADVSLQPFDQFNMDAIIVFNDILIPFQHMGLSVEFTDKGPAVIPPVRTVEDARRIHVGEFDETPDVFNSIAEIRRRVGGDAPIFGFGGAPFTMAAYMVEGAMSKNLQHIKTMVYNQPDILHSLLDKITQTVIDYLRIQIQAGADVVQIFDTWAGTLSMDDYRRFALPYQQQIISTIQAEGTPVVLYVNGSSSVLREMKESGASVLSVDWKHDLASVREVVGDDVTLQGNLDPTALYAPPETVSRMTKEILDNHAKSAHAGNTGLIFNLGHGILPETPVESVRALVETVQAYEYSS